MDIDLQYKFLHPSDVNKNILRKVNFSIYLKFDPALALTFKQIYENYLRTQLNIVVIIFVYMYMKTMKYISI